MNQGLVWFSITKPTQITHSNAIEFPYILNCVSITKHIYFNMPKLLLSFLQPQSQASLLTFQLSNCQSLTRTYHPLIPTKHNKSLLNFNPIDRYKLLSSHSQPSLKICSSMNTINLYTFQY